LGLYVNNNNKKINKKIINFFKDNDIDIFDERDGLLNSEEKVIISLLNLSMLKCLENVELWSEDILDSKKHNLLTICLIDDENIELEREIKKSGAHPISEEKFELLLMPDPMIISNSSLRIAEDIKILEEDFEGISNQDDRDKCRVPISNHIGSLFIRYGY
jgi:hypothetical protein